MGRGAWGAQWDEAAAEVAADEAQPTADGPGAETHFVVGIRHPGVVAVRAGGLDGVAAKEGGSHRGDRSHRGHRLHDDRLWRDRLSHRGDRRVGHQEGEHVARLLVGGDLDHHGALGGHHLHLPSRRDALGNLHLHLRHG